jgi:hypothetical protein
MYFAVQVWGAELAGALVYKPKSGRKISMLVAIIR